MNTTSKKYELYAYRSKAFRITTYSESGDHHKTRHYILAILANVKTHGARRDASGRFTKYQSATEPLPLPFQTQLPHDSNTRPHSSLSSFELLDNLGTQAPTPFGSTPDYSPIEPHQPLPNTKPSEPPIENPETMSTEHVAPFHGDKEDENPKDFLRSFFRRMGNATEEVKKQQFPNFLQADSVADEWFDDLADGDKKDWNAIEASFRKRWPRKKAAKKTTEEYEEEITGLRLKTEDLGKKEKIAGREVYAHVAWADKMGTVVRGAKLENTATYIGHVRKELPKLIREKVGAGHADWLAFLQAVRDVDADHIRDGVRIWKEEQNEQDAIKKRLQQLEKLTASPTAPLRQQMTSFSIRNTAPSPMQQLRQPTATPENPFAGTTGGRGNLFQATQTRFPPQNNNPRPPPTQADRAALLVCLQKYPHHPDTEAGRQAHGAQQAEWVKTHGLGAFVTESTPYPLRPGTLPVGSGECFTCGFAGHLGRRDGSTCGGNRLLNTREQAWRAICSRILRETRPAANIRLVEVDDYGTTWQEIQGNEDGPSN